jgi:hypothetical protein
MVAPLEPELLQLLHERHADLQPSAVEREPLTSVEQFGGAQLERLCVRGTDGAVVRYVVTRVAPLSDWLARATRDTLAREYQIVASGLLAELPHGVGSAVVAAAPHPHDAGRAVLLLRDVSDLLAPPGDLPFTDAQLDLIARGAARLHSAFAGLPAERAARAGLGSSADWLQLLSPATTRREKTYSSPTHFTAMFAPAWEQFAALYPDTWRVLGPLQADPAPLVAALDSCPQTLAHADLKAGNFAFEHAHGQLILLDWGNSGRWPGALDLAWCLSVNAAKLPHGRADLLERYRVERGRLGVLPASGAAWERELALGLLGGALLSCALKIPGLDHPDPATRQRERAELEFWSAAALAGARLL